MRVGCLFGTFDPPHKGHMAIAEHMLRASGLDSVWFVVTPLNPFKQDRQLSANEDRLAMVRLTIEGHQGLEASDLEFDLPKPSYTVDSLRVMRGRWPEHDFSVIIGSDNVAGFTKWKDPDGILAHHCVLVYPRDPGSTVLMDERFLLVPDVPLLPFSSTQVREAIHKHEPLEGMLDGKVITYIKDHHLYGT
ncbi:MAG TPA: nicotinate (nicotinamide) nucleotide adenylyltransferase [Flavobacteriales bacterium]|nr:nicotinate (nicotinamide) nucleotide adenylyltransferase [Flavobacteriales bacterium]